MKHHEKLGNISRQLCWVYDAWIIGGAVEWISNDECNIQPKDIDIVIPIDRWVEASKSIPLRAIANRFGGFKFEDDGLIVDVWADDLSRISLTYEKFIAYQPKYRIKIGKV